MDMNTETKELTAELAERGHCTQGGTIASGNAVCECGTWAAADSLDAESRKISRKAHLNRVGELRKQNRSK